MKTSTLRSGLRAAADIALLAAMAGTICVFNAYAGSADNAYMAGPEVKIDRPLAGDLIAAAGRLTVDNEVTGDAFLAAGSIEVRAPMGDDLRAAGGIVQLYSTVAGEALIAGGSVTVGRQARIARRAWIAGSEVTIEGKLLSELRAYGRHLSIGGDIQGPVVLSGKQIEILSGARINGDLRYSSAHEIVIDPRAHISGTVTRVPTALAVPRSKLSIPGLPTVRPLLLLGLFVAALVLYWLFPRFTVSSLHTLGATPLRSLGLGAGIFFSTPPIILLLVITIIGIPIALAVAAVYGVALLAGYLVCAFFIGEWGLRLARTAEITPRWRFLSVALALIGLALLRAIPYAGTLIALGAVILGLGAMVLQAFTHYSDHA